jgi:hypothetical protein
MVMIRSRPVVALPPACSAMKALGAASYLEPQLAVRMRGIRRVEVDAPLEECSVKVGDERTDVARRVRASRRDVDTAQVRDVARGVNRLSPPRVYQGSRRAASGGTFPCSNRLRTCGLRPRSWMIGDASFGCQWVMSAASGQWKGN